MKWHPPPTHTQTNSQAKTTRNGLFRRVYGFAALQSSFHDGTAHVHADSLLLLTPSSVLCQYDRAWRAGKRQMMVDTTAALGNGLLVGKDAAELGDHVNAVLHEGCSAGNGMCMCTCILTVGFRSSPLR